MQRYMQMICVIAVSLLFATSCYAGQNPSTDSSELILQLKEELRQKDAMIEQRDTLIQHLKALLQDDQAQPVRPPIVDILIETNIRSIKTNDKLLKANNKLWELYMKSIEANNKLFCENVKSIETNSALIQQKDRFFDNPWTMVGLGGIIFLVCLHQLYRSGKM